MRLRNKFKLYDNNRSSLKRIPFKVYKFKKTKWFKVKRKMFFFARDLGLNTKTYFTKFRKKKRAISFLNINCGPNFYELRKHILPFFKNKKKKNRLKKHVPNSNSLSNKVKKKKVKSAASKKIYKFKYKGCCTFQLIKKNIIKPYLSKAALLKSPLNKREIFKKVQKNNEKILTRHYKNTNNNFNKDTVLSKYSKNRIKIKREVIDLDTYTYKELCLKKRKPLRKVFKKNSKIKLNSFWVFKDKNTRIKRTNKKIRARKRFLGKKFSRTIKGSVSFFSKFYQRSFSKGFFKNATIFKRYFESLLGYPISVKPKHSSIINFRLAGLQYYFFRHWLKIDVLLWYLSLFSSVYEARQSINNNEILVNDKCVKGNYYLSKNDIISVNLKKNLKGRNSYRNIKNKYLTDKIVFPFLEFDYFTNTFIVLKNYSELTMEDMLWLYEKEMIILQLIYKK